MKNITKDKIGKVVSDNSKLFSIKTNIDIDLWEEVAVQIVDRIRFPIKYYFKDQP